MPRTLPAVTCHGDDGVSPHHLAHRLLGREPRSSGKRKAVTDMYAHLQAERISLRHRIIDSIPEGGRELMGSPSVFRTFVSSAYRHEISALQTDVLHALEVGAYGILVHCSVHPIPETERSRGLCVSAIRCRCGNHGCHKKQSCLEKEFFHNRNLC